MKNKTRKKIFRSAGACIIVTLLIHAVSAVTLDRIIEYKNISFYSEKLTADMNGYKIVFVTDTHAMTKHELEELANDINKLQPDLMLLGGDFPSGEGAVLRSMEVLSQVSASDGIFGVEGNHDNYTELFAAMEQYSITPLSNSGTYIRNNFYLAGTEDLWNRSPDIAAAAAEAQAGDFVLLLAHNPDVTMIQDTSSVDLILCGHTHGGQITFFGVWAPELTLRKTITDYGQRFMSGWAQSRDGTPVYVSRGTGHLTGVPRVFARPQVIVITLTSE